MYIPNRDPAAGVAPLAGIRRVVAASVAILLGSWVPVGHTPSPVSAIEEVKPNVLLIVTDDQRGMGTLGVMPKTRAWLGKGGTKFPDAFVSTPYCCPSRASIFTGRYPHNHHVYTNHDAENLDHNLTIQRYLKLAGYRTAIAGKFLNEWDLSQPPPYFDRWAIQDGAYYGAESNVDGIQGTVDEYSTTFLRNYALGVIDHFELLDVLPWFLVITPVAPHPPFTAEPAYENAPVGPWKGNPAVREKNKSDKPLYVRNRDATLQEGRTLRRLQLRTLLSVDDLVDQVMERLETTAELDHTLVIFTSDNGFLWGEHGLTHKSLPYTAAVKVPFLVRWPGQFEEGVVDSRLAMNVDIAPTVLDAADVSPDVPMDGWSLLSDPTRTGVLVEQLVGMRGWAALRTKRFHYIEYYDDDGKLTMREHYRLLKDPWQLTNVFGDKKKGNEPKKKKELRSRLRQARSCAGTSGSQPCP